MEIIINEAGGWDSGWVQAIGSIAAIVVGFAYVAVQHVLDIRREQARQREMTEYMAHLAADLLFNLREILGVFEMNHGIGQAVRPIAGDRITEQVIGEFLTLSPQDSGSAYFTRVCRRIGLFGLTFAHAANSACNGSAIEEATLIEMRKALAVVEPATAELQRLTGIAGPDRNPS